jgi:hypothetical protein
MQLRIKNFCHFQLAHYERITRISCEGNVYIYQIDGNGNKQEILVFSDGKIYEGEFEGHRPHGEGVLITTNGTMYDVAATNGRFFF